MDISKLIKLQVKYLQKAVSRPLFWCSFIAALDVWKTKQTNFDKFFVLLIKLFFALMAESEFQWQYQAISRQYQIKEIIAKETESETMSYWILILPPRKSRG